MLVQHIKSLELATANFPALELPHRSGECWFLGEVNFFSTLKYLV
jgi:hypothetical protein